MSIIQKQFCFLIIVFLMVVFFWGDPLVAQQNPKERFEIGLFGGFGVLQGIGDSAYANTWNYWGSFMDINEVTQVKFDKKKPFFLGASFTYNISSQFGLQIIAGYHKTNVPNSANFSYSWSVNSDRYSRDLLWVDNGKISSIPLSLNLLKRFYFGKFQIKASGGVTLYMNSFQANSSMGMGDAFSVRYIVGIEPNVYSWDVDYIDAYQIPVYIPETKWNALGGNIGVESSIFISKSVSLFLDVRYYLCPKKEMSWTWTVGKYEGIFLNLDTEIQNFTDLVADLTTQPQINPSFFSAVAGIKINF